MEYHCGSGRIKHKAANAKENAFSYKLKMRALLAALFVLAVFLITISLFFRLTACGISAFVRFCEKRAIRPTNR